VGWRIGVAQRNRPADSAALGAGRRAVRLSLTRAPRLATARMGRRGIPCARHACALSLRERAIASVRAARGNADVRCGSSQSVREERARGLLAVAVTVVVAVV
jgi:hypothetical protein